MPDVLRRLVVSASFSAAFPLLPASALDAGAWCKANPSASVPQKIPSELETSVGAFLKMKPDEFRQQTFVRCARPKLMVCVIGANLACGKADTRRDLPGATAFCKTNPDASIVPFVATGHDTIYEWHCVGRKAVAGKAFQTVDRDGYISANWSELR